MNPIIIRGIRMLTDSYIFYLIDLFITLLSHLLLLYSCRRRDLERQPKSLVRKCTVIHKYCTHTHAQRLSHILLITPVMLLTFT